MTRSTRMIHETAVIESCFIGDGTKVWHFAHIRKGAKIGKNCVISKDVYIDHDVIIGDNCKIENGVSIYYGVEIEDEVIIGPNATFTNDKYPRACPETWEPVKTFIRKGASIGAGAVVVCGVEIGEYAMIGAGAVITKDVKPYSMMFAGDASAKFVSWVCKCGRKVKYSGKVCERCKK